jgi:uncharacterized OB-fold protein
MTGYRCSQCGRVSLERPDRCRCGSQTLEAVELSGKGKVYTCTTLYAAAEPFEKDLPFQIAIIELDEGPRLTVRIEGPRVAIDDPVHLAREQEGTRFFAGG